MKKITRNIILIFIILLTIFCISGCSLTNTDKPTDTEKSIVAGGEIVRYDYCVLPQKSHLASIPIITTEKINNFEFLSAEIENKNCFKISLDNIELDTYEEYKNYYIYFMVLNIENVLDDNRNIITDNISAINFNINNKYISYKIPYFRLSNGILSEDDTAYIYNDKTLLFGGGGSSTLVYSQLPTENDMTFIGLTAKSDIVIDLYYIFDFVTIENFMLEDELKNSNNINVFVANKENIIFDYSLKYNDGISDCNIVRVARAIIYTDNGVKKAFVDGAGVYIYPGFSNRKAVKNYIDLYLG